MCTQSIINVDRSKPRFSRIFGWSSDNPADVEQAFRCGYRTGAGRNVSGHFDAGEDLAARIATRREDLAWGDHTWSDRRAALLRGAQHGALAAVRARHAGNTTDELRQWVSAIEAWAQTTGAADAMPPEPAKEIFSTKAGEDVRPIGNLEFLNLGSQPASRNNGQVVPAGDGLQRPAITLASEVTPRRAEWLWHARLEAGELNLLVGYPGVSKSILTADIAARVTTGAAWPDLTDRPRQAGDVILLAAEDSIPKTIVPRLIAAGADLDRVGILRGVIDKNKERPLSLATDLASVRLAIRRFPNCRLLVVDPVNSYLGNANSNSNEEVRAVLEPLRVVAESAGVAVLLVMHVNKSVSQTFGLDRVGGSRAFTALARTVSFAVRDEDDPGRVLYITDKCNNAKHPESLAYAIETNADGRPEIVWSESEVEATVSAMLGRVGQGRRPSATREAAEWLQLNLANGPVDSAELMEKAELDGYSRRTIMRARAEMGVKAVRFTDDKGRLTGWRLGLPGGE